MSKRIYKVHDKMTGTTTMIRATSQAQARHAASRDRFVVEVASQDDLVAFVASNGEITNADSVAQEPAQAPTE